jgi:hypothetical protein
MPQIVRLIKSNRAANLAKTVRAVTGSLEMKALLQAIVDDDRPRCKELLKADRTLVAQRIEKARLCRSGIFHWLYVGDTPLHFAAAGHRAEIVDLLLAVGADPNAAHNHRRSGPLHYAADGCPGSAHWNADDQVRTIERLLDAGAEINAQDKNGAAALHRAVRTRCAAAVKLLLQRGADPLLKNKPGSTPFHLAVQNTGRGGSGNEAAITGQREIIEQFLALGLKPTLKNSAGKTVLDSAQSDWIRDLLMSRARSR